MLRPVVESVATVLRPVIASFGIVLLASACGDGGAGPEPVPVPDPVLPTLETLEVTPAVADLCMPGKTARLTIVARDQTGEPIPDGTGAVRYSSSAPTIAQVSSAGVVTGAGPGTAVITVTFTLGDNTRTASMIATVHETTDAYREIEGVYDVTAVITRSGWGMEGTRETAVMTIQHSSDSPLFVGTFEDLRFFYPGDDEPAGDPLSGSVSGSFDCVERVVFELRLEGLENSLWYAEATFAPERIVGVFSDPGSNTGTFTAERRQAQ
jgi:Bacterial Ig-like domain (group 2)